MWVAPFRGEPEDVTLTWSAAQQIQEIRLTLNDDVNEDLINLHHHRTDFPVIPELLKDFTVDYLTDTGWQTIETIQGNRQRHLILRLPTAITTKALRVRALTTNGSEQFSLVEIRAYATIQNLTKGVNGHERV